MRVVSKDTIFIDELIMGLRTLLTEMEKNQSRTGTTRTSPTTVVSPPPLLPLFGGQSAKKVISGGWVCYLPEILSLGVCSIYCLQETPSHRGGCYLEAMPTVRLYIWFSMYVGRLVCLNTTFCV